MNSFVSVVFIFGCFLLVTGQKRADNYPSATSTDKRHHIRNSRVKELLQKQVSEELGASFVYLAMAAHFGGEKKNRPGFEKFFRESAQEEFGHAQKFIDYMTKRGVPLDGKYFTPRTPQDFTWLNGYEALKDALQLEGNVTKMIEEIHREGGEDGHLTNFLESEFLDEQVDAMRQLSGYVNNLRDMALSASNDGSKYIYDMFAEYMFDLQLQGKKLEL